MTLLISKVVLALTSVGQTVFFQVGLPSVIVISLPFIHRSLNRLMLSIILITTIMRLRSSDIDIGYRSEPNTSWRSLIRCCWTSRIWNSLPTQLRQSDITLGQFDEHSKRIYLVTDSCSMTVFFRALCTNWLTYLRVPPSFGYLHGKPEALWGEGAAVQFCTHRSRGSILLQVHELLLFYVLAAREIPDPIPSCMGRQLHASHENHCHIRLHTLTAVLKPCTSVRW